jgi:hypothetical protein
MRENGIVDDPSGIEKLENFKSKLRERQNRQFGTMVKVKMKDLKLKDNLKTLLDQRRVQLGSKVASSTTNTLRGSSIR